MNAYTFHITLYDLAFLGAIFIGLNFALQLWFTKGTNSAANRFLSLALLTTVLWMAWVLGIDVRLAAYFPRWSWLPLQFSLVLGPLIFFYVLKISQPAYKFRQKDLLHFSPLLLQQGVLVLEIRESIGIGAATYNTAIFKQLNPALQLLTVISVIIYLYSSHRLIARFYQRLKFNDLGERYRFELRWLHRLLVGFGLLWFLWILILAVDYFYYHHQLGIPIYYSWYLLLAVMMIKIAAQALLKAEIAAPASLPQVSKLPPPQMLKQKGIWLKKAVEVNLLYQDAELSLYVLAEKLDIHPHELSRIINVALKKNFNDFINEYRVRDVTRKMQDPAYDRLTLQGIAFESGFNSRATFNRTFRQMTGKSPKEYKNDLEKERSTYHLRHYSHSANIISVHEVTPKWSSEKLNRNYMFRNYLKVAWRNLSKYKAHTIINVAGLSVGLACSLLILLWVQNEKSVDAFHKNSDQLFKVYGIVHNNGQISGDYSMPGILSGELKKTLPEVQYAVNMGFGEYSTFQVGDKILKVNGNSAGADYFKMFSFRLLQGNAENALKMAFSIAISRKMAEEFYGSPENAIGKTIRYQNNKNFTITAVFENLPHNVSTPFDFLTNWEAFLDNNPWARNMGNVGPECFIMLRKDANAASVDHKIRDFYSYYFHADRKKQSFYVDLALQPYAESYLNNDLSAGKPSGGRIETVRLFSIIAIFILLIACINFMNLASARSVKRAREVGVRKAVGALRSSLIKQFIGESLMVTAIAVIVSLVLVIALLPIFNDVTQKQIGLPFNQWQFWAILTGITLITGLVSGSYPALFLSSLNPVKVLKGALKLDTGTTVFRKGLVVFQFVLSSVLITGTIIVSRQMNYIQSRYLGYDKANLLYINIEGELDTKYPLFKQELLNSPNIQSVSRMNNTAPQDIYGSTAAVGWTGKDTTRTDMFTVATVGYDFLKTMKMSLATGRDFSRAFPSDSNNYILNETAVKATGYKDPIGKPFRLFRKTGTIIGVVKDFNFHSMSTAIGPIVFNWAENSGGVVLIRTQPGKTHEALANIERLSKQINPAFPPDWHFVDQEYQKLYQNEQIINKLSDAFSFLAIFISCLGLLGLAMFTAEQRLKEISIRKVLGASVSSLFKLLSQEFIVLVVIAFTIATPIAWYAMNKWLLNYAYYIPLEWWMFAFSGALTVLIALATVSYQAVKAALVNPIKSLRSE